MKNCIIIFISLILISCDFNQKSKKENLNNDQVLIVPEREIEFEGIVNFRDLGGIINQDGKKIKWGKLYRSAKLDEVTYNDSLKFSNLGISKIVDFRTNGERIEAPDFMFSGVENIHLPMGDDNWSQNDFSTLISELSVDSLEYFMLDLYSKIPIKFSDSYKSFFSLLKNEDQPILYHCTAGKDRTGIASSLILYMLDIDMKTIQKEYELSNYYRKEENLKYEKMLAEYGISPEKTKIMMELKPSYITAIFDTISEKYGSLDNYLEKQLNVSNKDILLFRDKFLEQTN